MGDFHPNALCEYLKFKIQNNTQTHRFFFCTCKYPTIKWKLLFSVALTLVLLTGFIQGLYAFIVFYFYYYYCYFTTTIALINTQNNKINNNNETAYQHKYTQQQVNWINAEHTQHYIYMYCINRVYYTHYTTLKWLRIHAAKRYPYTACINGDVCCKTKFAGCIVVVFV